MKHRCPGDEPVTGIQRQLCRKCHGSGDMRAVADERPLGQARSPRGIKNRQTGLWIVDYGSDARVRLDPGNGRFQVWPDGQTGCRRDGVIHF